MDINRVLIEDRLAVRLIGLNDETNFKQDPAFENDRRYFIAATFKPFEHTTLSASFEKGWIDSTLPRILPPTDYFTNWFDLGKPTQGLNADEREANAASFLNTHPGSSSRTNFILVDALQAVPDSEVASGRFTTGRNLFGEVPNPAVSSPGWRRCVGWESRPLTTPMGLI